MISNTQELQSRARELALTHTLADRTVRIRPFWATFQRDLTSLENFSKELSNRRADCTQPAEDWLLNHVGFLEAHAHSVLQKLPRRVLHQLPKLRDTGYPRIYGLCDTYLQEVGGRYDPHTFELFIQGYQDVSVLKLAECWHLPVAMSVIIIKHLAETMKEVRYRHNVCHNTSALLKNFLDKKNSPAEVQSERRGQHQGHPAEVQSERRGQHQGHPAEVQSERRGHSDQQQDEQIRELLARHFSTGLTTAEVVHILRHLGEAQPDVAVLQDWLKAYVENSESSLEGLISLENELQANLQLKSGNLVQSLHTIERQKWRPILKRISSVHQIFLTDPTWDFQRLDDASQDALRNEVARLAASLKVPETLVAQTAVQEARDQRRQEPSEAMNPPRNAYTPYYLLDPRGRARLQNRLSTAARPRILPKLKPRQYPSTVYTAGVLGLFLVLMILGTWAVGFRSRVALPSLWAVELCLLWPVSEWVVTLLHASIGKVCRPQPLLRYDFSKEIPEDARTMVVIPIIWGSVDEVDEAVNRLQVHYFANPQKNLSFALLADFRDAETPVTPTDDVILQHAVQRVEALGNAYGSDRFYLFHRNRSYNSADKLYMGWERKRGKLVEFVKLLLGFADDTHFSTVCGDRETLRHIRYVMTVDADTQLPFGVVGRMAGTLHFPLNRPRLNAEKTRVSEGYGVLQPRLGVSWESTERSRFASLWAGLPGFDPYAFAASNPYQDLFGQGIFVGKGIFDIKVFDAILSERIPDNQVLSHDILEGGFLRTALTADIEVVEDYPTTFYAYQKRAHRWIRGDWQLIPWLGGRCRQRDGIRRRNDLPGLTRWQILDNIRRSLLNPILFLVGLLATGPLPGNGGAWVIIVVATLFLPFLQEVVKMLTGQGRWRSLWMTAVQSAVVTLTLPFATVLAVDAIVRALYRMYISGQRLLEWATSARINRKIRHDTLFVYEAASYGLIAAVPILSWWWGPNSGRILGSVAFLLWLLAYPVVWWLNKPFSQHRQWIAEAQSELADLAGDIWSFFETYVTANDSWLPPDNVQFFPKETIAHRTSPTNIGLYLGCVLAAHDLGLISVETMLMRLERCLDSVQKMEKWRGHLFNWYNTETLEPLSPRYVSTVDSGNLAAYFMLVRQALHSVQGDVELNDRVEDLMGTLDGLLAATDFQALYNADLRLFYLGFHVENQQAEGIVYDLLASEARQVSFVAIALGQIPASHWFTLGRTMTMVGKLKTLLSWSGTMFEYFMPGLILRSYRNSLWDRTYRGVIKRQQNYVRPYGIPFGISESGYYAFDYQLNYQYRAFGVPGLGFAEKLEENLVVAPYATILSLSESGKMGLAALSQFRTLGARGKFGYFEAVDFTRRRLPEGRHYKVIESFMSHHQGMSLLALVNLLRNDIMVERFHSDLRVQAARLLLQERVPQKAAVVEELPHTSAAMPAFEDTSAETIRRFTGSNREQVSVNLLSNGAMSSLTTTLGDAALRWQGIALTRWGPDPYSDKTGPTFYLRNLATGHVYNLLESVKDRDTEFQLNRTRYQGSVENLNYQMDVTVAADTNAELRRIDLKNQGDTDRWVELTTFYELALAPPAADIAHPAFSKLFVETSEDREEQCLLARRRPREADDKDVWAGQTILVQGDKREEYEFETDRAAFIGRGNSLHRPKGLLSPLVGSVGAVVDPAFIFRRKVRLEAGSTHTVYVVTAVANSREEVLEILRQLKDAHQVNNVFHLAWMRGQVDLQHLHLSPAEMTTAQTLASRLLFVLPRNRRQRRAAIANSLGQTVLWTMGISGDDPIIAAHFRNSADFPELLKLACQQQYLQSRGLPCHLVVLDETSAAVSSTTLMQMLQNNLVPRGVYAPQKITVLAKADLTREKNALILAASKVEVRLGGPSLDAQLRVREASSFVPERELERELEQTLDEYIGASLGDWNTTGTLAFQKDDPNHPSFAGPDAHSLPELRIDDKEFFNGWGGFVKEGHAYQVTVQSHHNLPKPWSNVLANPGFGCLVTELGTGYTWWRNSRQFKLTPWSNDVVLDTPGEVVYLRDMDTGEIWSPTPKPAGTSGEYTVTHGWGYSRFEHDHGSIAHTLDVVVPLRDPVKVMSLTLHNRSSQVRRIAVSYYAEWVLGESREKDGSFVVSKWNSEAQALLAHNAYEENFKDAIVFLTVRAPAGESIQSLEKGESARESGPVGPTVKAVSSETKGESAGVSLESIEDPSLSWTTDKREFFGNGSLQIPHGLLGDGLSRHVCASLDTCGVVQRMVEILPGEQAQVVILLGCTESETHVKELIQQYQSPQAVEQTLQAVAAYWDDLTGKVQVHTPNRSMDILLNGWLLYQAVSCRLWARTAFYQAGGAFGFRDQLQDALALLHADPGRTRQQILLHAAHQYVEGDVQHWWHDDLAKGIRTRFSDDLLWLPYALFRYLEQTEDWSILTERVHFLESPALEEKEMERYEDTVVANSEGSVLEHALRAVQRSLRFGPHGIPLMGSGDWNDGMNGIGSEGTGESVWLGWFVLDILQRGLRLHEQRLSESGDPLLAESEAARFTTIVQEMRDSINRHAWDGAWFRRAYSDDGAWLGTVANIECYIDAIAQSWSVISDGTSLERQYRAMDSFEHELVDSDLQIAKLLWKPFDKSQPSPGYIQGYAPGLRENGGQYTHGVIWSVIAWAILGQGNRALDLFNLLNPITHTETPREVQVYGNEPYVMSADVYSSSPHLGMAGWSWYTGAAGWMYQAGLEYILGIRRHGSRLSVQPATGIDWQRFSVDYTFGRSLYHIEVVNNPMVSDVADVADVTDVADVADVGAGAMRRDGISLAADHSAAKDVGKRCDWTMDGRHLGYLTALPLVDDGHEHKVLVRVSFLSNGIPVYGIPERIGEQGGTHEPSR